jgi:hypothetical protein
MCLVATLLICNVLLYLLLLYSFYFGVWAPAFYSVRYVRAAHFSASIFSFFASLCSEPCSLKLLRHLLFLLLSPTSTQPVTDALLDLLGKLDPDLDTEQSGYLDPDPEPYQSEKVEALEGHFGAWEGPFRKKNEW